jgi:hypothetical protein
MNVDYKRKVAVMQPQHQQPQLQAHRRAPLASTAANNVHQPQPQQLSPPKPPPKGTSPPLPRQNSKTAPPTPPKVIVDRHNRFQFTRVGFLGEGGFARVFEVKDPRDTRLACKVITKTSLKTKKAKTKVWQYCQPFAETPSAEIMPFLTALGRNQNPSFTRTPQYRAVPRLFRRRGKRVHDTRTLSIRFPHGYAPPSSPVQRA